jgi:hypothetical protein
VAIARSPIGGSATVTTANFNVESNKNDLNEQKKIDNIKKDDDIDKSTSINDAENESLSDRIVKTQ